MCADNVHFENAAELVKVLTEARVDFRVQFYTNKDHSIGGAATRYHLYRLLTNFMQEALDLPQRIP